MAQILSQLELDRQNRERRAKVFGEIAANQPVKSHLQGLNKVLASALGGYEQRKAEEAANAAEAERNAILSQALNNELSREQKIQALSQIPEYRSTALEAALKQEEAMKPMSVSAGSSLINPVTGEVIYQGTPKQELRSVAGVGLVDVSDPSNPRVVMRAQNRGTSLTVDPQTGAVTFNEGYGVQPNKKQYQFPTQEQLRGGMPLSTEEKRGVDVQQGLIDKEEKAIRRQKQLERSEGNIIQDIGRSIEMLDKYGDIATGIVGAGSQFIPQTPAYNLGKMLESAKSNISIQELQSMREGSPTGGALGQVPVQQQEYLMQLRGSLQLGQDPEVLKDNMKRVWNTSMDIVHGTPQEIEQLIQEGRIERERGEQLKQRYSLGFDEFGRSTQPQGGLTPEEEQELEMLRKKFGG